MLFHSQDKSSTYDHKIQVEVKTSSAACGQYSMVTD